MLRAEQVIPAFASTYREARGKFVEAATGRHLSLESQVHPSAMGAEGEELAIDVAHLGDPDSASLLVLLSGMHGVEGFCGSGCQVALLRDDAVIAAIARARVAVLFCHAINPYGFSHVRRVNEDNVDLNRNFRDFSTTIAPNADYASVHSMVVPATWPPSAENTAQILDYVGRHGVLALQAAVSRGQSDFPDGLFFAGREPAWSNVVLRDILKRHGARRKRIGWIDFHTGLGAWGHGEKIHSGPDDAAMIARNRAWYGCDVTTFYDGSSSSAQLTGVSFHAALASCPHAEFTGIGLEFGTRPYQEVFQALRAEQWLANHPGEGAALRAPIKRQMRDAFHDDSDAWKAMVYGQARVAVLQAVHALR
ncbi:MAG TPA: M14 family metallopeptidase [Casimicrobiaceae bacterium]